MKLPSASTQQTRKTLPIVMLVLCMISQESLKPTLENKVPADKEKSEQ